VPQIVRRFCRFAILVYDRSFSSQSGVLTLKTARSIGVVVFCVVVAVAIGVPAARAQRQGPSRQDARTLAERKIDGRVLSEIYRRRGDARQTSVTASRSAVRIDRHGRALVDVRAQVKPALEKKIKALGGVIVSTSGSYDSIVGWVPLLTLERLAADATVRAIEPATD
jgi:hypothetical protein